MAVNIPPKTMGDFVHGFLGDSIGHWEGDTLVVDTVGFNEQFWFARAGYPHTESLHLTERITRVDYDTLKYECHRRRSQGVHQAVDRRAPHLLGPG
ncbi:MAG: hypothetical protein WDO18_13510 [Acidobacteriota bacterium]